MSWKLYEGDCFDYFHLIKDNSINMILCDLPYGTTACEWDTPLNLEQLWVEYKRIIKPNGIIVLTASQPFTTDLINSNFGMFKYTLVWDKIRTSGGVLANKMPLRTHEDIIIFYKKLPTYNPQMTKGKPYDKSKYNGNKMDSQVRDGYISQRKPNEGVRFPKSILTFSQNWKRQDQIHPTQKPVKLFEYLIKTYTNEHDLVLDNCAGSGTTGVACYNTNRNCIMMEKEEEYCNVIRDRMKEVTSQKKLEFNNESKGLMDFV